MPVKIEETTWPKSQKVTDSNLLLNTTLKKFIMVIIIKAADKILANPFLLIILRYQLVKKFLILATICTSEVGFTFLFKSILFKKLKV